VKCKPSFVLRACAAENLANLALLAALVCATPALAQSVTDSPHQAGRETPKIRPQGDAAVIRTVIDAVGLIRGFGPMETTNTVNRLRWGGDGIMSEGGRSYQVSRYDYSVSLLQKAAREDITRKDSKGATTRIVQVVAGTTAWNESSPGVASSLAQNQAASRLLQFWRTPFGIAKYLATASPGSVKVIDDGSQAVRLNAVINGVSTQVTLDKDYRPWRVTQLVEKKRIEDDFTEYRDFSEYGLMFPGHIVETVNAAPYLDIHVRDADVASYIVFPPPTELMPSAANSHKAKF
jgi:hypothetical protein